MKKIKCFIMDVDGTLTDGKIYMGQFGEICKAFNVKDGYGIHDLLMPHGVIPIIITGRKSDIVLNRCKELGIMDIYQGVKDKIHILKLIGKEKDILFSEMAYIGDDINDLLCMKFIKESGGIIGCPKDAITKVIKISDYVSEHNGGDGAVRDFIEWICDTE